MWNGGEPVLNIESGRALVNYGCPLNSDTAGDVVSASLVGKFVVCAYRLLFFTLPWLDLAARWSHSLSIKTPALAEKGLARRRFRAVENPKECEILPCRSN